MERLKRSIQSSLAMDPIQLDPGIYKKTSQIQLLYGAWVNMAQFTIGLAMGFAPVQIPQLTAPNSNVHITREDGSWIASIMALCCPIGCIIAGIVMDRYGRRIMLIFSQVPMFFGWLYTSHAKTTKAMIFARAITGVGCGMAMGPPRVYCTEISLPNMRGVIGSFPNMAVAIGIAVLAGLGTFMPWKDICYVCCFLTFINFCSFTMLPETPYYILQHKSEQEARENLAKFRSSSYDLDQEMDQLIDFKAENDLRKLSFAENMKALFNKASCKPFILVITYVFFAQAAGNSFILTWSIDLLMYAHSSFDPEAGNVLLGLSRVVMSGVTAVLLYRIGRRPLAIMSAIGVTIVCLILGLFLIYNDKPSVMPLICLMLYMVFATVGYYTLPMLMGFELYPLQVRGILGGATVSLHCIMMFASVKIEPFAMDVLGISYTFVTFGVFSLLGGIFLYLYLPETKDLTLQEIEEYYNEIRPTLVSQRRIISMSQVGLSRASMSTSGVTGTKLFASKLTQSAKLDALKQQAEQEELTHVEDDDRSKPAESQKILVIFEEPEEELITRSKKKDKRRKKMQEIKDDNDDDQPNTSKK